MIENFLHGEDSSEAHEHDDSYHERAQQIIAAYDLSESVRQLREERRRLRRSFLLDDAKMRTMHLALGAFSFNLHFITSLLHTGMAFVGERMSPKYHNLLRECAEIDLLIEEARVLFQRLLQESHFSNRPIIESYMEQSFEEDAGGIATPSQLLGPL